MAFRRLLFAKASAWGIPRYAELARPLVWCIVLNAGREHPISINKDMTVGRNNMLMNQPKTYPSKRLQHIKLWFWHRRSIWLSPLRGSTWLLQGALSPPFPLRAFYKADNHCHVTFFHISLITCFVRFLCNYNWCVVFGRCDIGTWIMGSWMHHI